MVKLTPLADSLDGWPSSQDDLETASVQCVGQAFIEYQTLVELGDKLENLDDKEQSKDLDEDEDDDSGPEDSSPAIDLFSLTEKQLTDLNYYQVLHLPYKPLLTPDDVKKAYRKASLKYHPDKSGRGEEDAVFLKVKSAFEVLSTQKQAYDSTEMPFDGTVPEEGGDFGDFFDEYGPVFDRNLHFDARLLPGGGSNGASANGSSKKNKNRRKSGRNSQVQHSKPPPLGDDATSIDQVHEFYDYWTHFTSWRDFGLQAARELETAEHLENAESRFEKRWYQKEIDRRAKKLKQQEQARITTLVERAMAVDPRLIQERKRQIEEKEMKQKQREQDVLDKKRQAEEANVAEEQRINEEKGRKAQEKLQREKEKKMLRKAKQGLRRVVAEALAALLEPEYALDDPVDDICGKLSRNQLLKFTAKLESLKSDAAQVVKTVKERAANLDNEEPEEEEDENEPPVANGHTENGSAGTSKEKAAEPAPAPASKPKKIPFTMEELSTLAKGVKKFPAGGNRWDQITNYINAVCRPDNPRTKEECIEVYNQNKGKGPPPANSASDAAAPKAAAAVPELSDEDVWTEEQDKLLQEGLVDNPANMDKNERWANISNLVPGKSKKQCVNRFKAIRDAIKNKK
jgi:DnaJ family protein C protein 2